MLISNTDELTKSVIAAMERTSDPRLREILVALIRHLHAFVKEVRLTEEELRSALAVIARIGQLTTDTHNEAVLLSGSLGVSNLVCLMNNGNNGATETSASLLGPFWRLYSPKTPNGASIVRSPTPGPAFFFTGHVVDRDGRPVANADVDVWHSSSEGFYDIQDPNQADMNLRGQFETDASGTFSFRSIKPIGYPIPTSGNVVGDLLRSQSRHNMRPAHVHLLIFKPGYKTLISQVFMPDDPHIDDDVQFGVTRKLVADLVEHDEPVAAHPDVQPPWYSVDYTFVVEPGEAKLPRAPIK
jgi:catechol 1,2-dioxygenase